MRAAAGGRQLWRVLGGRLGREVGVAQGADDTRGNAGWTKVWNSGTCVCNGTCYARKKWAGSAEGSAWQGLGTWLRHSGKVCGRALLCASCWHDMAACYPRIMDAAAAAASHDSMAVWVHSGLPCAACGVVVGRWRVQCLAGAAPISLRSCSNVRNMTLQSRKTRNSSWRVAVSGDSQAADGTVVSVPPQQAGCALHHATSAKRCPINRTPYSHVP